MSFCHDAVVAKQAPGPVQVFARNLKALRKKRHFSQEFLAEKSGVHATEISGLERGDRDPRLTTIFELAEGLSVSIPTLLEGVEVTYLPEPFDIYAPEDEL